MDVFGWLRRINPPAPPVEESLAPPVPVSDLPRIEFEDRGEAHSRLWVHFLTGAVALLQEEVDAGVGDIDEKRLQIAEKQREIRAHSRMYPDDTRDIRYLQQHLMASGGTV